MACRKSGFNVPGMLADIAAMRITATNLASMMVQLMVTSPARLQHDLSSLRFLSCGGAPLASKFAEQVVAEILLPNAQKAIDQANAQCDKPLTPDEESEVVIGMAYINGLYDDGPFAHDQQSTPTTIPRRF